MHKIEGLHHRFRGQGECLTEFKIENYEFTFRSICGPKYVRVMMRFSSNGKRSMGSRSCESGSHHIDGGQV